MFFWFLLILLPLTYLLLFAPLWHGWKKSVRHDLMPEKQFHPISVIIPVRDERTTILTLLAQLELSTYPEMEVIVVDDHSSDGTFEAAQEWIHTRSRFRCVQSIGEGKKKAITQGITQSKGSLIVTTDGDCEVAAGWLHTINRCFQGPQTMLAFGGVAIQTDGKLFSDMQAIEFTSLIGSGASFSAHGSPVMCNGANLSFRKSAFESVDGYEGNFDVPSGDDEFLMRKILRTDPNSVMFIPHEEAVVRTRPKQSLNAFLSQRIRWAGKWKRNDSIAAKFLALYVLVVQCTFIGLMLSIVLPVNIYIKIAALIILSLRFVVEGIFLRQVCHFLHVQWRWAAYVLLQLFYPIYVVGIGLFSNFKSVTWKNRRIL